MTTFDFRDGNGPVPAYQHPNGGGWVADTAKVAKTAYVGPDAQVYGNALVYGNARVYGYARVKRGSYKSTPTSITRSDGYTITIQSDGSIVAGCRDFTPEQADEHWGNPNHHMHKESWAIVQALRSIQASKG